MNKLILLCLVVLLGCGSREQDNSVDPGKTASADFTWDNATIYFLLVDRFNNADTTNDSTLGRENDAAVARGFMGGDLKGITQKIREGYFENLGVNAIWFTPVVEQIHGAVDEGTGKSYGFHGYWTRDWSALDPNFGSMEDLGELVKTAHDNGIRIIFDVVLNHTGPVTEIDSQWPESWVRTSPQCTYLDAETTISCTLVKNLPDILTEKETEVEIPVFLADKWKAEGRYEQEMKELDEFFARTGYPRAPKYYIIKWLTDYVREFGIDGFRVDTAKHVEDEVWATLYKEVMAAFEDWRQEHPDERFEDQNFYMVGEVYGYSIGHGRDFPMGPEETVDFYKDGFHSLINFAFKSDARKNLDSVYTAYSNYLHGGPLEGKSVVSYISSHDDGHPFDRNREMPLEAGTRLMLAPGGVQIYYGDEIARPLMVAGAEGDAHLRSYMDWDKVQGEGQEILQHWSKLGRFRHDHPAVGAGVHKTIAADPFVFSRVLGEDKVLVALGAEGNIPVGGLFPKGTILLDEYSGAHYTVTGDVIRLDEPVDILLLAEAP